MFLKLLAFELRFHIRQPLFLAATAVFVLVGLVTARGVPGVNLLNSPFALTYITAVLSLGTVIAVSLFAGGAVLRDREHRMEGIIFATNLTHAQYVVSRFAGLVAAAFLSFAGVSVGLYLARFLPWMDPASFSHASPLPYLWALVVMGLPNVLLGCAVVFATAALTRHSFGTYLSGILLYVLYWVGSLVGNSPLLAQSSLGEAGDAVRAALLEPFGLVAFMTQTRYWSMAQKDVDYLALEGPFLLNRLLWLGFSLCLFAVTYKLFSFRVTPRAGKPARETAPATTPPAVTAYRPFAPAAPGAVRNLRVWAGLAARALKTQIKGFPFAGLLLLWTLLVVVSVTEQVQRGQMNIPYLPLTGLFLDTLLEPLTKLGAVVVMFYAAELTFFDRDHEMDGLIEASPVSDAALALARVGALAGLIALLISYTIAVAAAVQLTLGATSLNLSLYALLFVRAGLPLLSVGVLALVLCNFFRNKYLGMGLSFMVGVLFSGVVLGSSVYLEHPLLRLGFLPEFVYSPMADAAYHDDALPWFAAYWLGAAVLMLCLALRFWRRGPLPRRLTLTPAVRGLALAGLLLTLCGGWVLFRAYNLDHTYRTADARRAFRAAYEHRYGAYAHTPTVQPTELRLQLDLYPDARRYRLHGEVAFVNHTSAPLERILVGTYPGAARLDLSIEGAQPEEADAVYDQVWYRFAQPLPVGGRGVLHLDQDVVRDAYTRIDAENYVLPAASYVEIDKVLPFFGIDTERLLRDPAERTRRGLPPRTDFPEAGAHTPPPAAWITYDLVVSTAPGQETPAPGMLKDTWETDGRPHCRYVSAGPVPYRLAVASARYETQTRMMGDIAVTAYYAPGHGRNVPDLLQGCADTLAYGSTHFAPYPDKTLRFAELPSFSDAFGGTAYRDTIFGVENRLYLLDQTAAPFNMAYRVATHEVAHQWWGYQLQPADAAGYQMLTELLAVYTEEAVQHQADGAARAAYLDAVTDLYFFNRGYEEKVEQPLSRVQFQPYVYYFKGAHVVHALRELLGTDTINAVLQAFLAEARYPAAPLASDLAARLYAAAPEAVRADVADLLNEVVTYDVTLLTAEVRDAGDGASELTLQLRAEETRLDADGTARTQALTGPLEAALMRGGHTVATLTLTLSPGGTTYTLPAPAGIDRVVLDPRRLLLEADRADNAVTCTPGSP